ncbi:hypothetical protein RB595_007543 [Gaeumannomyces hyphopodioides]
MDHARRRAIKARFVNPGHPGARELFEAARRGDVENLEEVLMRNTSIDINGIHRIDVGYDEDDHDQCWTGTALHATVRWRHLDAARLLLDRGADVNADAGGFYHSEAESGEDEPGGEGEGGLQTPLHTSLMGGRPFNVELVRVLLQAGADVNLACLDSSDDGAWRGTTCDLLLLPQGETDGRAVPLILEVLALFERHGLDVEKPLLGSVKETFARSAVDRESTELLRWGVSRGVSVPDDLLDRRWVDEEMLRCLVEEAGFRDVNLKGLSTLRLGRPGRSDDDDDATLGLIRRILGNLPAPPASELVSKALCAAVAADDRAMVRFWPDRGADVNQASVAYGGMTPLFAGLGSRGRAPEPGMVRMLLEGGGTDVVGSSFGRFSGRTPLLAAFTHGCPDVEVVRMLLDKGADVNARSTCLPPPPGAAQPGRWGGRSALHEAARHGSPELVQLLLDAAADTEARNDSGETPLLALAYPTRHHLGLVDCARILLAGSAAGAVDYLGRTLLHLLADPEEAVPDVVPDVVRAVARVAVDSGGVDLAPRDWSGHTATDRFMERFGVPLNVFLDGGGGA